MDYNKSKRRAKYSSKNKYKSKIGKKDKILKPWRENNSTGVKTIFRSGQSYGVNPDPFPPRLVCRMKFADNGILNSAGVSNVVGTEKVYRLSSIHDPDYTIGGATTVGWAQMNALYYNYIVTGVLVEVDFYDPSIDAGLCVVSLNQTDPVQSLSLKQVGEHSLTYTDIINNTGSQKKTFRFYVRPWNLIGLSKLEWLANKTDHSAAMNNSPTTETYLRIAYTNYTVSSSIKYVTRIIYFTELFNRKQLASDTI